MMKLLCVVLLGLAFVCSQPSGDQEKVRSSQSDFRQRVLSDSDKTKQSRGSVEISKQHLINNTDLRQSRLDRDGPVPISGGSGSQGSGGSGSGGSGSGGSGSGGSGSGGSGGSGSQGSTTPKSKGC